MPSKNAKIVFLERLPIVMSVILLFAPGLLQLASLVWGRGFLTKEIKWLGKDWLKYGLNGPALVGLKEAVPPPSNSFFTGDYQKNVEEQLNRTLPLRPRFVRATNQAYYSLFGKSYMHQELLVRGKNDELYEEQYIVNYCGNAGWFAFTDANGKTTKRIFDFTTMTNLVAWSGYLHNISAYYKQQGKTFLYVIAPSKASHVPENSPLRYTCPIPVPTEQYDLPVQHKVAALEKLGLPYVNGVKILAEAKEQYPVPLFPKGATHWNLLGASLVTQAVQQRLGQLTQKKLPPIEFSYQLSDRPYGGDADLINLLNAWEVDYRYPVPLVTIKTQPTQNVRVAVVGDSFGERLVEVLVNSQAFCQVDEYRYLTGHSQFVAGQKITPATATQLATPTPAPPTQQCGSKINPNNPLQSLLEADILIVEQTSFNSVFFVQDFSAAIDQLKK
jgi:hypothetical protein